MMCPYGVKSCLCQICAKNIKRDGCRSGYCIDCLECEEAGEAVHNVYYCGVFVRCDDSDRRAKLEEETE